MKKRITDLPFQEDIRHYAARTMGNWSDADDVVQETAFRYLKAAPPLEGRDLRSFLYRTARNYMVDVFRKRKLAKIRKDTNGNAILPSLADSASKNPALQAEKNEETERVSVLIRTLPPQTQEILRLRYYENMKTREIAEVTGISYGYVRKLLCETIRRLCEQAGGNS